MTINLDAIPNTFIKQAGILVRRLEHALEVFYMQPPKNSYLIELQRHLKLELLCTQVNLEQWRELLANYYNLDPTSAAEVAHDFSTKLDLLDVIYDLPSTTDLLEDDTPIIRLINAVIHAALTAKASDIHLDVETEHVVLRHRIDGILYHVVHLPRILAPLITARIKIMANLDIAEKRLPQDGHISLHISKQVVDIRVAIIASQHGERVVLRLLDKANCHLALDSLGMSERLLTTVTKILSAPYGLILVTGPTGAGKTSTLYAMLSQLNNGSRNIITIEDPIEYNLAGITQIQVNQKAKLDFASILRAILRHDPDIIMVGEIRDSITANIAIQASLTGHLVLSTLHTNNALATIQRLLQLGIPTALLADSLKMIIGQRLIRLLCPQCKLLQACPAAEQQALAAHGITMLAYPQGCTQCKQHGYLGRSGLYELLSVDQELAALLRRGAHYQQLAQYQHYLSFTSEAYHKLAHYRTSLAEVHNFIT